MTEEIRLEEPRLPAILSKFDADAAIIVIVYLSLREYKVIASGLKLLIVCVFLFLHEDARATKFIPKGKN